MKLDLKCWLVLLNLPYFEVLFGDFCHKINAYNDHEARARSSKWKEMRMYRFNPLVGALPIELLSRVNSGGCHRLKSDDLVAEFPETVLLLVADE